MLGALNAVTKEIITVTNESYINSNSICSLLITLASLKIKTPITIILDNARYQKCYLVQNYAKMLGIELVYLPTYSPHLNLIERLWKFVKKECLYSKYYEYFGDFKNAIIDCLEKAHNSHYEKLNSLLTWNFQSFENVNLSNV